MCRCWPFRFLATSPIRRNSPGPRFSQGHRRRRLMHFTRQASNLLSSVVNEQESALARVFGAKPTADVHDQGIRRLKVSIPEWLKSRHPACVRRTDSGHWRRTTSVGHTNRPRQFRLCQDCGHIIPGHLRVDFNRPASAGQVIKGGSLPPPSIVQPLAVHEAH